MKTCADCKYYRKKEKAEYISSKKLACYVEPVFTFREPDDIPCRFFKERGKK